MSEKKVLILYNPISGKGASLRYSNYLKGHLEVADYKVHMCESQPSYTNETSQLLEQFDFVIVAGGDGTLLGLLPQLARAKVPFYMAPTGNESLFAREFRMLRSARSVLSALQKKISEEHYFGTINQIPFFTMLTVGLDSQIIADIDSYRDAPIGKLGYVLPSIRKILTHRPAVVTLKVDGKLVIDKKRGFLVIANTKQYALGIGLVPEASSKQAVLHGRFFPYSSLLGVACVYLGAFLRRSKRNQPVNSGTHFEVVTQESYPVQADGEHVCDTPALLAVSSSNAVLVLTP